MKSTILQIKKIRRLQENKLIALALEAKKNKTLLESRNSSAIRAQLVSEATRLITNIKSLMLLEQFSFASPAFKALQDIQSKNLGSPISDFLLTVPSIADDLNDRLEELDQEEKKIEGVSTLRHGGYGGPKPDIAGAGAGTFSALKEGIFDTIKDVLKGKPRTPVELKPSELIDPVTGKVVGRLGPSEKTAAGKMADITKEREEIIKQMAKDEPKLNKFMIAYLKFFFYKDLGELKAMAKKKGMFGGSELKSFIKDTFGKVPGFDVSAFTDEMTDLLSVAGPSSYEVGANIRSNMALAKKYHEVFLQNEEVMQQVAAATKKGRLSGVLDFLGGFGVGAGPSSSRLAETKKKNFRK